MPLLKPQILSRLCYTVFVYSRINKKLKTNYTNPEIEKLLSGILQNTPQECFETIGKNIYVTNTENNIRITINQNTCRVITVDRLC